jgi:hypothetical protein
MRQVSTSRDRGGIGFLFWNARNDYSKPYAAMPVMKAHADQYFGKRPVPAEVEAASAKKPASKATVKLAKTKQAEADTVAK